MYHILFVSKNNQLATQLKQAFSSCGFKLHHTIDGQDALFIAATQEIQLVIAEDKINSLSARSMLDYIESVFNIDSYLISNKPVEGKFKTLSLEQPLTDFIHRLEQKTNLTNIKKMLSALSEMTPINDCYFEFSA